LGFHLYAGAGKSRNAISMEDTLQKIPNWALEEQLRASDEILEFKNYWRNTERV
jgi:hypothetical protein